MVKSDLITRLRLLLKLKLIWLQTKSLNDVLCLLVVKKFHNQQLLSTKMKFLKNKQFKKEIWLSLHQKKQLTRIPLKMCGQLFKQSHQSKRVNSCCELKKSQSNNKSHLRSKQRVSHLCINLIKFPCLARKNNNYQSEMCLLWNRKLESVHKLVGQR